MTTHGKRRLVLCTLLALLALWWGLVPRTTQAEWILTSSPPPVSLDHGALLVTKHIARGSEKCELTLVFFDESQSVMQVASNTSKKEARSVEALAMNAGAIAACNGGYFDPPKMLPSGLEIAGGIRTGTLDRVMPFGGMLLIEGGKSNLLATEEFTERAGVQGLVQCCPRLVESGRAIEKLGESPPAERTFIFTDGQGRWAMGVSKSIRIQDLARVLGDPKIISEFQVQRALNLDGGPSTALWCKPATGEKMSVAEIWKVRNAILVVPRKQGG